jgi:hypothetical protein
MGGIYSRDRKMRNAYKISVGKPERDHSEDLNVKCRISEWILGK